MYILKLCAKVVKIERKTKKKLLFLLFALPRCANSDRLHPERILPSRRIFRGVNECLRRSLRTFTSFSPNICAVLSGHLRRSLERLRHSLFSMPAVASQKQRQRYNIPIAVLEYFAKYFLFFQSRLSPVVILVIWSFGQNQFQGVKIRHYIINIYIYI